MSAAQAKKQGHLTGTVWVTSLPPPPQRSSGTSVALCPGSLRLREPRTTTPGRLRGARLHQTQSGGGGERRFLTPRVPGCGGRPGGRRGSAYFWVSRAVPLERAQSRGRQGVTARGARGSQRGRAGRPPLLGLLQPPREPGGNPSRDLVPRGAGTWLR